MTHTERPSAVGYVSATDAAEQARQRDALVGYAKTEGLRLASTFVDPHDGWTISQLVEVVDEHKATCVLIPAGVHLAEASARVSADLAARDARCIVVDDSRSATSPTSTGRPAARLPAELRRRALVDADARA